MRSFTGADRLNASDSSAACTYRVRECQLCRAPPPAAAIASSMISSFTKFPSAGESGARAELGTRPDAIRATFPGATPAGFAARSLVSSLAYRPGAPHVERAGRQNVDARP